MSAQRKSHAAASPAPNGRAGAASKRAAPHEIPGVGRARAMKVPPFADEKLPNGLRVVALRRPTVPRIEIRLRIPAGLVYDSGPAIRARLVPETLLGGTAKRSAVDVAMELQRLGASLGARAESDDLVVAGGALAQNFDEFLDLLTDVTLHPAFPADEVAVARDRGAQEILIARSQPGSVASEMLAARIFGKHRYGRLLPAPDAMRRATAASVRAFHAERVLPKGSTLVIVGALHPADAIARAKAAFSKWKGHASGAAPAAPSPIKEGMPTLIVHRPGAVQTNVRFAGPGLARTHADFAKLALANMVCAGYFASRMNKNLREEKGYTYGAQGTIAQRKLASTFVAAADVATEVTIPALVEARYEFARMAALPVGKDELDQARQYLAGVTMLSMTTQAGLASYVDSLISTGLGVEYLKEYRARLDRVTLADVREVSARFLTPKRLLTVLVGDADVIKPGVEAYEDVEVVPSP
jgi:zinc protease